MTKPRNLTPDHLRCAFGTCPAVYDITPEHLKCGDALTCPSVSTIGDGQMLLIVGKRADQMAYDHDIGVGPDEYAIVIGAEYFANLAVPK
jgi:hypothetical protein